MTVRELIIETQLQIQRLNGFKRDKTDEQKLIWRLNTAQDRFIRGCIKLDPNRPNRYLIDQESNTAIQRIKSTNVPLQTIIDEDNRVYSYLPSDFRYLLNDRSRVLEDCKQEFEDAVDDTDYPRTVRYITFADSTLLVPNYYKTIVISITLGSVTDTQTFDVTGTSSKKEKFEIIPYIISQVKSMGYELYWESFAGFHKPNCFLFVPPIGTSPTITITIDGVVQSNQPLALSNVNIYKTDIDKEKTIIVPNRAMKDDFIYDAITHNYYDQPQPDSPISILAGGKIFVFQSKRFLVSEILVDYIRVPRRISLYLDHTCELDESVHEKICSIAAEMLLGNVEASNYQTKVQENINRLE